MHLVFGSVHAERISCWDAGSRELHLLSIFEVSYRACGYVMMSEQNYTVSLKMCLRALKRGVLEYWGGAPASR